MVNLLCFNFLKKFDIIYIENKKKSNKMTININESYPVNDVCDSYIHEYDDCIKVKFYCLGGGKYGKVIGIYKEKN